MNTAQEAIARTAPSGTHVAIVGSYADSSIPSVVEYLTPDYDLADRIRYWETAGWRDVHAAREVTSFVRLTAEQAEQERSR